MTTTTGYSITKICEDAKLANNGRLTALSMTGEQKRAAEKAVARGVMKKFVTFWPGFGAVDTYSLT